MQLLPWRSSEGLYGSEVSGGDALWCVVCDNSALNEDHILIL